MVPTTYEKPLLNASSAAIPIAAGLPVAHVLQDGKDFNLSSTLGSAAGLLIRERFFWSQALCGACEKKTQFRVAEWNPQMPSRLEDKHFTSERPIFEILEESTCCQRYCCHQNRALELGLFSPQDSSQDMSYSSSGWPTQTQPQLTMQRPFRCPCYLCCYLPCPQELIITGSDGVIHGRVVQDWRIWNCCWPCDQYMGMYGSLEASAKPLVSSIETQTHYQGAARRYTLQTPRCFGSWCMNCCAPSCFNPVHTSFILSPNSSIPVGYIENQWPGCNTRGICMWRSGADNYVVKFPVGASVGDKEFILGGWALSNFMFWEKRGNQK